MSSGEINHASPSGRLTDTSGMRKRIREHDAWSPDSDQPIKMFSRSEVQGLLQQEVHSAMKQSESKMESLLERVQLLECEPKYDLVIRRLEAHIKKVKRRGDAAISYVRMLRAPGVKHNQRTLGSGLVDLTETEAERGLSTVDISRSDSDEDDSAEKQRKRKVVDGFWQKMMSNTKAPDRKREKERNGKKHNIPLPPTTPPLPPTTPPRSPLPPILSPQVLKVEASVVPVTRPPTTSPVKMEGTVKMENTVKTEESPCPPVALRVPPSQSELLSHLPPLPPTPFPSSLPLEAASYSIPQKPLVHLARIRNPAPCLVIHWRVTEEDPAAPDMDSYSIYIAQESHSSSVSPSWRNVGVVKALALPMAVTVTKYQSGTTYVIVVGKDRYGRYGPYSDVQTVLLA
ncbi:activating transcription factor 7-interacting protein 1-like isoform X2 [Oncorhynchus masou masou]|uniref:activating transcription factor 7-interacting protein 1-like isoform X2 n=1 Tax=Oncorhynchus masou masou TaxID=90313 RepID=UPI003184116C